MTAISHSHPTQAVPTNAKRFEDKRTFVNFQSDISKTEFTYIQTGEHIMQTEGHD